MAEAHGEPSGQSRTILPSLLAGAVAGLLAVTFQYSYAAVILSEADPSLVPQLTGHFLFGGALIALIVGLKGQFVGAVALPQDTSTAVLAVIVASVAASSDMSASSLFPTIIILIVVSSLAGAVLYWIIGRFRLAILGQYVPYPVVAGFLAAAGWLLFKGSFPVMANVKFELGDLGALGPVAKLWLPGVAMAVVLVVATRRTTNPFVVPGVVIACTGGFHVVRILSGQSMSDAADGGWLLEPLGAGLLVERVDLGEVEWGVIGDEAFGIGTVLIITTIGVLLNLTALSAEFRQDIDVDKEMRLLGGSNLAGAATGSIIGYHLVSLSTLGRRMNGNSRVVGVTVSVMCLLAATVAASLLSYIPNFVLGGVVMFIGLGIFADALIRSATSFSRADIGVVFAILAVVELVGFLEGIAIGLLITIVHFVVTYSRIGAIRHVFTGAEMRSTIERPTAHRTELASIEEGIILVKLQGYVFFASTVNLVDRVTELVEAPSHSVTHVILDFEHVTGIDASGFQGFVKLERVTHGRSAQVVYAALTDDLAARLETTRVATGDGLASPQSLPSAEAALQWCEDQLLREQGIDPDQDEFSLDYTLREMFEDQDQLEVFREELEEIQLPAGATLVGSGDPSGNLDFVEVGQLEVLSGAEGTRIRIAGPGSVLGAAAFFRHGGGRSLVTLVAETDCTLYRLTTARYMELRRTHPAVSGALQRHLLVSMADRYSTLLSSLELIVRGKI